MLHTIFTLQLISRAFTELSCPWKFWPFFGETGLGRTANLELDADDRHDALRQRGRSDTGWN